MCEYNVDLVNTAIGALVMSKAENTGHYAHDYLLLSVLN